MEQLYNIIYVSKQYMYSRKW